MDNEHWEILLERIADQKCTPFLGAGAAAGRLPLGSTIAQAWAREHDYPLDDPSDLARVAQFLAVKIDAMAPKEKIKRLIMAAEGPSLKPDDPHAILATLPLPLYLTTNYDSLMVEALRAVPDKEPQQGLCRWKEGLVARPPDCDPPDEYRPTVDKPLVYHLHGHLKHLESLVLTEDDYFDFLVNLPQLGIPPLIQEALSATSLLFVGYRLADWNFRVLFRGLVELTQPSDRRVSVTVQLPPTRSPELQQQAMQYLARYFDKKEILVFWGDAAEFSAELRRRWHERQGA